MFDPDNNHNTNVSSDDTDDIVDFIDIEYCEDTSDEVVEERPLMGDESRCSTEGCNNSTIASLPSRSFRISYPKRCTWLWVLSAIVFAFLAHTGNWTNKWTIHPGESRKVKTSMLSKRVAISTAELHGSSSDDQEDTYPGDENVGNNVEGLSIFVLEHQCPTLSGPRVLIEREQQIVLHNACQYDTFYLNKGSTLEVEGLQTEGSSKILLLRGTKVLRRIQSTTGQLDHQNGLSPYDLVMLYDEDAVVDVQSPSAEGEHGAPIQLSFTSPDSALYVLLYDNPSTRQAAIEVDYRVSLTTYDLVDVDPWCNGETVYCPPIDVSYDTCVLIQGDLEYIARHGSTIQVTVHSDASWLLVSGLALLPSFLLAMVISYRRTRSRMRRVNSFHASLHNSGYYNTMQQPLLTRRQQSFHERTRYATVEPPSIFFDAPPHSALSTTAPLAPELVLDDKDSKALHQKVVV